MGHSPPAAAVPGRGPSYWEASAGKLLSSPSLSQPFSWLVPMKSPGQEGTSASTQPGVLVHPILLWGSSTWLMGGGSSS